MPTVLIRVSRPAAGGDCTVELLAEGGDRLALETLPQDLPGVAALEALAGPDPLHQRLIDFYSRTTRSPDFELIGRELGALLLAGAVGSEWDRLHAAGGLRTLLQVDDADMAQLPWELIHLGQRRLFADEDAPWARVSALAPDPVDDLFPLRLLVVEAPGDGLETGTETGGIKAALGAFDGAVDAHFLTTPTEGELRDAFEFRPHIFHFSGHGMTDPDTKLPGLKIGDLVLTSDYVVNFLPKPLPRLVVLNACRTGTGDVAHVGALTQSFLDDGAVAVVGMRGDIRGAAAAHFGEQLYRALAAQKSIDAAVAAARSEVSRRHGVVLRDWTLPSLTLRVPPEHVLPLQARTTSDDRKPLDEKVSEPLRTFVDRSHERRKLTAVDPHTGAPERLVVVQGEMESGKTALLLWIRRRSAMRGVCVRYVDFRSTERVNFVRALEIIRDEADDVASIGLAPTAFSRFNYDLGFLVKGVLPETPSNGVGIVNPPTIPDALELGENIVEDIFGSFRRALQGATSEARPLVLILDHIGSVLETDFKDRIYPLLIKKVVEARELAHVRIVVVLSPEQRRDYWPSRDANVGYKVPVDLLKPADFQRCAEDVVLALGKPLDPVRELIAVMQQHLAANDWVPSRLNLVRQVVEAG